MRFVVAFVYLYRSNNNQALNSSIVFYLSIKYRGKATNIIVPWIPGRIQRLSWWFLQGNPSFLYLAVKSEFFRKHDLRGPINVRLLFTHKHHCKYHEQPAQNCHANKTYRSYFLIQTFLFGRWTQIFSMCAI